MYYPDDVIEEVRTRNDIVDVISQYVNLKKKGANYFGLCPFHNEKSPSFSVSPGKQMYYCFGCGAGGNVITFVMEYENYSFVEAVKMLADRVGITLPEVEYTKEAKAAADLKNTLLEINRLAANYFYYQLKQPHGKIGYDYLKRRQLTDETIKRFGLGFANKTSNDLYQYMRSKGYSDAILKETGLFFIEERGAHDKFWNRVMFPILDVNNRVIGFGGRVMGEGEPKYLNSPETKLFDKSRNLYGLNYARTSRAKYMLICEGYMDVIALHQAGFTNAVASLGTAFTSQHAVLLKRYTDQVVLTYDSDGAGVRAALRAIPILKEVGMSVKVLDMKPYKDPDEFIKNLGQDEFQKRIDRAVNSFMFEISVIRSEYNMQDPESKTGFYNAVARKLLEFSEKLERDNYTEAVAREYMIPLDDLKRLVATLGGQIGVGVKPKETDGSVRAKQKKDKEDGIKKSQRLLLTWLIERPELFDKIEGIIAPEDFIDELYQEVAGMVFEEHKKGNINPAQILNRFIEGEEQYREVAALFHASLAESLNNEEQKKAFSETVKKIKKNSLEVQSRRATDIAQLQKIIRQQSELANLKISLD
ncbi:MAG: DNA primase [Lachnospiraceae bacterium]|nr:DNA primase [Lachnospiraceae bacterium]MBQ2022296.1 DNA primase [Lachnospiraceae bacterium]MBQ2105780.1 DNA primase [Lachnospiraceae bacterium]MBQ5870617.1 DNA primase [Lachnospiraceae bacterium]MBQ5916138.1 DNA primase [Lachnospiraceae bacterium]